MTKNTWETHGFCNFQKNLLPPLSHSLFSPYLPSKMEQRRRKKKKTFFRHHRKFLTKNKKIFIFFFFSSSFIRNDPLPLSLLLFLFQNVTFKKKKNSNIDFEIEIPSNESINLIMTILRKRTFRKISRLFKPPKKKKINFFFTF